MYARIARFEGLDAVRIDAQVAEMRRQIEGVRSGELPAGAPEQVRILAETVKHVYELVDRANGTGIAIMLCATEDDLRRADAALNEMSPGEGEGRRSSVELMEVVIDEPLG
jgi:hypothetical protein